MNRFLILLLLTAAILTVPLCVSADFTDDFSSPDSAAAGWSFDLLYGRPNLDYLYPQPDRLSLHLPDYNTAIYMTNENTFSDDSTVELTIENVFSRHSEVGLVCRSNESGWYELRVTLSGQYAGSYTLYRYEKALKDEGKNPFVLLVPEFDRFYTRDIKVGRQSQNTFKMICEADQIRVFINGKEQTPPWNNIFWAKEYASGINGFSVRTESPYGNAQIDILEFRSLFEEE